MTEPTTPIFPEILLKKRCSVCREVKSLEEFVKARQKRDGYTGRCKACKSKKDRANYTTEKGRRGWLRQKFGITPEDYDQMLADQGGRCAICGREDSKSILNPNKPAAHKSIHRLHVDHDHETGQVRALLCGTCNRGIGMFLDNADLVYAAATYLRSWELKRIMEEAS